MEISKHAVALALGLLGLMGLMGSAATAADVPLAWSAVPGAVEYVVWSGPFGKDFDRAALTTNTTHTVTNLAPGNYRFGLAAFTSVSGTEIAEVSASVRPITFWLEKSSAPHGPWRAVLTNVSDVVEGEASVFYRVRLKL